MVNNLSVCVFNTFPVNLGSVQFWLCLRYFLNDKTWKHHIMSFISNTWICLCNITDCFGLCFWSGLLWVKLHVNVILSTLYSILTVYYSRVVLHVVFRETFIKDSQTQGSNPNKGDNPSDEQKSLTATVKVKERQEHWCSHHNRSQVQRLNSYISLHLLIYMLRDVIIAVVHNKGTFHMDQSFWGKSSQKLIIVVFIQANLWHS